MNDIQKQNIARLRGSGLGYGTIASRLGLPLSTVKTYCKRNSLSPSPCAADTQTDSLFCPQCGKDVVQAGKRKPRRFCSEECRVTWWNCHKDLVTRKAVYGISCAGCGMMFESYGDRNRKYCSHTCYISTRFGVNRHD